MYQTTYYNYRDIIRSQGFTEHMGEVNEEIDRLWASIEEKTALNKFLSLNELKEILHKTKIYDGYPEFGSDAWNWLCLAGLYVTQKLKSGELNRVFSDKDIEQKRKAKLHNSIVDNLDGKKGLAATLEKYIIKNHELIGHRNQAQRIFCVLRKIKKGKINNKTLYFTEHQAKQYFKYGGTNTNDPDWADEEGIGYENEEARVRGEVRKKENLARIGPETFGANLIRGILNCFIQILLREMENRPEDWELDNDELEKMVESFSWSPRVIEIGHTKMPDEVKLRIAQELKVLENSIQEGFEFIRRKYEGEIMDTLNPPRTPVYVLGKYILDDQKKGGPYECLAQEKVGSVFGKPVDRQPTEDQKWEMEED